MDKYTIIEKLELIINCVSNIEQHNKPELKEVIESQIDDIRKQLQLTPPDNAEQKELLFCECDAPLIRTSNSNKEYCGLCCNDIKQ